MRLLALKVDVDTWRGTLEGVPNLVRILRKHTADATFLFSLGPDHTGRAIRRVFRPGFMSKVSRTSVLEHYGWKTLLYGTLLPGPHIAQRGRNILLDVAAHGFETGIHTWDHIKWQDFVARKSPEWTRQEMQLAHESYVDVFNADPPTHGAAGWQMNDSAYRQETDWGMAYCSDTRGPAPFVPLLADGTAACVQLPTTLPTLDELIGLDGIDAGTVAGRVLALTEAESATGHVYTLHAELEGMKLASAFEALLSGWRQQGYRLVSLAGLYAALDVAALPRRRVGMGTLPGRSGTLAMPLDTPHA
ncbi:MAG: polysaccharide deacetylase family protein [Betaproteobacteria bacterium]|nr:polysaccharide deacetylase family protein [Betaproteobacteria bacterium]